MQCSQQRFHAYITKWEGPVQFSDGAPLQVVLLSWSRSGRHGASQVLGPEGLKLLKKVAQVLSLACSLEQRAALERARDDARSQHIGGLVEQARRTFHG